MYVYCLSYNRIRQEIGLLCLVQALAADKIAKKFLRIKEIFYFNFVLKLNKVITSLVQIRLFSLICILKAAKLAAEVSGYLSLDNVE